MQFVPFFFPQLFPTCSLPHLLFVVSPSLFTTLPPPFLPLQIPHCYVGCLQILFINPSGAIFHKIFFQWFPILVYREFFRLLTFFTPTCYYLLIPSRDSRVLLGRLFFDPPPVVLASVDPSVQKFRLPCRSWLAS